MDLVSNNGRFPGRSSYTRIFLHDGGVSVGKEFVDLYDFAGILRRLVDRTVIGIILCRAAASTVACIFTRKAFCILFAVKGNEIVAQV
jgi:hypothetical protein